MRAPMRARGEIADGRLRARPKSRAAREGETGVLRGLRKGVWGNAADASGVSSGSGKRRGVRAGLIKIFSPSYASVIVI